MLAGALTFENALKLVSRRGELMSELGRGGMVATTLDLPAATAIADKHFCGIAAHNMPEQVVVAGETADLDKLAAELEAAKKRAVRLNTEGAFHTFLMVSAAQQFRQVLEQTEFSGVQTDVLSNYTGKLHENSPEAIRSRLFFQLFNPVQWVSCMNTASDHGLRHGHRVWRRHRQGRRAGRQAPEPRDDRQEMLESARARSTIPARHQRRRYSGDGRDVARSLNSPRNAQGPCSPR